MHHASVNHSWLDNQQVGSYHYLDRGVKGGKGAEECGLGKQNCPSGIYCPSRYRLLNNPRELLMFPIDYALLVEIEQFD